MDRFNGNDRNSMVRNHLNKMSKSIGDKGTMMTKYEYIRTRNDLVNSYLTRMDDLGYPLRVEPKRDRYVLNKKGLEQAIEKVVNETFKEIDKEVNI